MSSESKIIFFLITSKLQIFRAYYFFFFFFDKEALFTPSAKHLAGSGVMEAKQLNLHSQLLPFHCHV